MSWWIAKHVADGRQELNFSEWPHDRPRQARSLWRNMTVEVEGGSMPLPSFTWIHTESRLTGPQRQLLIDWAEKQIELLKEDEAESQQR